VARHRILYSSAYIDDYKALEPFDRAKIRTSVLTLADQAEVPARNRRPLEAPRFVVPGSDWKLRIEDYRLLYRVDGGTVFVLRVRLKGSQTIEEMGS